MTKRPLCLGAAGVLSGILAAAYGWSVFARALLACGVLACGILGGIFADGYRPGDGISTAERKRTAFGAGVFLLMFALGSGRYLEAEKSRQAYLGELQDGMYVTVQGQLAGKQIQKNRYVYELTSCMFRTDSSNFLQTEPVSCGGVLIYSESDDCSIGDILICHGEITLWKRASNEGAFDAKAYYFARGFDFAMEGPALDRKVCAKRQTAEALWQLGQRIKEVYLKTMGERDAGILATMVVGDREFLDAETKRLYQIGGLVAHSGDFRTSYLCDRDGALPDVKESGTAVWHGCPCSGRSDVRIRRDGWMGRFRETRGSHVPAVSGSTGHREEL